MPIEKRVFAGSFFRDSSKRAVHWIGCKNEYLSAQLACRSDQSSSLSYTTAPLRNSNGDSLPAEALQVRFGAFLPVDETGIFTADPLLESSTHPLPANLVQPVWLTLHVPTSQPSGIYRGSVSLTAGPRSVEVPVELEVLNATLPDPPDYSFYLNLWQDPHGVARAHKVSLWSEEHWRLLARYAENLALHGEKSIMTSIVHDPWNAQTGYEFPTMVEWQFPGEWTLGETPKFSWDFRLFDRYVSTMIQAGVKSKIDMYAMVKGPGPTPDASIRYYDSKSRIHRTEALKVGDPKWKAAWRVFLPALKSHLEEKGWWKMAYLGFDEKPKAIMDQLNDFIKNTGPEFRLVSSGGHATEGPGHEVVIYWDHLQNSQEWEKEYRPMVERMREKGQLVTFYTACEPRFPNTYIYSSLRESRMLAWIAWKYNLSGYTRWAVNAFPDDVWSQPNFNWHSGDMYFQYPGKDGPLDGMRWELMRQGIQDYEALRIAHEMATFWGRSDLLKELSAAVEKATILDSCRDIPLVEEAREIVNKVLRQVGSPSEMGKELR
ncbi:MAG: glycoside hydrolase domain-containing protein [Acidobacteriota bacterium]